MANGDLLRQLFRGYAKRDDSQFRAAADAVIRAEKAKNHRLLADDLERILRNGSVAAAANPFGATDGGDLPRDRERGFPLLDVCSYAHEWDRIVVSPETAETLRGIVREHHCRDLLLAANLRPRQRLLFYGPPGCGKTLAASVIASVLSYPLALVRFDAIVSSYLGETAANLRRVFEYVSRGQWVVFFDEFDAIGKDRDSPFEHGELKRVVNTLLQMMDAFQGESLLIAATNHEALLDSALWRRFEEVIAFRKPSAQERVLLLRLFLGGFDHTRVDLVSVGSRLKGSTGSDIEQVAKDAARSAVLDARGWLAEKDLEQAVSAFRRRSSAVKHALQDRCSAASSEAPERDPEWTET